MYAASIGPLLLSPFRNLIWLHQMRRILFPFIWHEYIETWSKKSVWKITVWYYSSFRIKDQRTLNFCSAVVFNCLCLFSPSMFYCTASFHIACCLARVVLITLPYWKDLKAAFSETLKEKLFSLFHTVSLLTNQEQITSNTLNKVERKVKINCFMLLSFLEFCWLELHINYFKTSYFKNSKYRWCCSIKDKWKLNICKFWWTIFWIRNTNTFLN